jgi:hypothetical protein
MSLCMVVAWLNFVSSCMAVAQSSSTPTRSPVPSKEASESSYTKVKEIYGSELAAATSPKSKSALARQFAGQADATDDTADRWVLLSEALRLATDAGDAATAIPLIDRIPAEYAVEARASRLEALSRLVAKVVPAETADVARRCLDIAREISASDARDLATRADSLATAAAKKSRNADLVAEALRLSAKHKERQKIDKELQSILTKLNAAPDDPELRLEAGQLLFFRAGRWKEGLPLLEKGSDPQLAAIARLELAAQPSSEDHVRLGDAWWEWAEPQKSAVKVAAQMAAVRHYSSALPETDGLEKARLEKRLNTAAATSGGTGEAAPLALLPEIDVVGAQNGMSKNGTFNGKPFTCRGKKYPTAVFTHPSDKGTAKISFRVPAGVRRLRGTAGIFSLDGTPPAQQPGSPIVMSIVADGEVLWTSPQLTAREQSVAFDVDIAGCVRLELHTTSVGAANTSWGAWLDPVLVK